MCLKHLCKIRTIKDGCFPLRNGLSKEKKNPMQFSLEPTENILGTRKPDNSKVDSVSNILTKS